MVEETDAKTYSIQAAGRIILYDVYIRVARLPRMLEAKYRIK